MSWRGAIRAGGRCRDVPATKRGTGEPLAVIRFSRFDGGDYGVSAGFRAPKDSFSGQDMVALLDGSVAPRCGTTAIATAAQPTGKIAGMGFFNQDAGTAVPWFVVGTAAYASVTTPVALTGTLASTPTLPLQGVPIADKVYISNYGDKLYRLSTTNCDPLGGLTPGGKCAVAYGDRLLVANFPANPNRVRFSDANDFTTYGALNFFDVGQGGQIVGMWAVRTNIFIAKNDGTWWIYTGVPGSGSDILRLAYSGLGFPADWRSGAVVGGSNVYFVAQGEQFPSYFNGSNVSSVAEQDTLGNLNATANTGLDPLVSVMALSRRGDVLALAGRGLATRTSLLFRDGKWSRASLSPILAAPVPGATRVLVSDGGDTAAQATFAWWVPTSLERPPLGGAFDAVADVGTTLIPTLLTLPEYVDSDGRDMKVTKVLVAFRRFNQAASNRFKLRAVATRRGDGSADKSGTYRVWEEPSTFGSATGVPNRLKFMAVDQDWGTGWRIELAEVRGVIIDEVSVYFQAGRVRT